MKKILLAMSGGTDSSVSAMLLQEQGFEVVGLHISFFHETWASAHVMQEQAQAQKNVEELCSSLGIEHHEIDASEEFYNTVVRYFVNEYSAGRTPFPCAVCNPLVKWRIVYNASQMLDCEKIATGHYVQIQSHNNRLYVTQGADPDKDQAFFLWGLSQEILQKTVFPLGSMLKSDVRKYAQQRGFQSIAKRKDSLGVCFLACADYRPFVRQELAKQGKAIIAGTHIDLQGNALAPNEGYAFYTVGQRKNLGYNANKRLFVHSVQAEENTVILSEYKDLYRTSFRVKEYYFHSSEDYAQELTVKIRYRNQENVCRVEIVNAQELVVHLHTPLEAVAPGQTAVFYSGKRVVGGGFIA
ncbi:MAG: tRNA 2-thiouridine(34) synthase MnmA [Bacteroidales bacterium]|jgi:tRNA-specific 2-thiouridylase|nr:tRNA 2-thiouridine(34) synthase MnmA [Bacteroidales bacterium]